MKNTSKIIFSISLLFIAVSGFTPAMAATDQDLALQRLQDKINTLEKGLSDMQQELYRNSGKSKNKQPVSAEPIGTEDERDRAMNGKIEELEHNISTLAAKLDKIIADIDFRVAALEKKVSTPEPVAAAPVPANPTQVAPAANQASDASDASDAKESGDVDGIDTAKPATVDTLVAAHSATNTPATPAAAPTKPAAAPAKASSAAKIAYDKAYEFISLSKYDEAEKAFKDFIVNNKGSDLVGNAYYWLGESYYSRQNYQSSAVNFLKGYQDFPKGNKATDSLFKLGLSLKGMKKEKEACATFSKLKKEYPKVEKSLLAQVDVERKTLKCK